MTTRHRSRPGRHPLAASLRGRRIALGYTLAQTAMQVGVRPGLLAAWEAGRQQPEDSGLAEWAAALGCEIPAIAVDSDRGQTATQSAADPHPHPDGADPQWQAAIAAAQKIIYGPGEGDQSVIDEALTAAIRALGARLLPAGSTTRVETRYQHRETGKIRRRLLAGADDTTAWILVQRQHVIGPWRPWQPDALMETTR